MRFTFIIPVLIAILLIPLQARAVDQDTIDRMTFLLQQPEWDQWGDGVFGDNDLLEGLSAIYDIADSEPDDIMMRKVIWAMGETGLVGFVPAIIAKIDIEPVVCCYALGKIPSVDGVNALIEQLDSDDMHVRDAAVWGLGKMPYDSSMEEAKDMAVDALSARLSVEEEYWVADDIEAAITLLVQGIIIDEIFIDDLE